MRIYHNQFAEIHLPFPAELAAQRRIARLLASLEEHVVRSESVVAALRQAKAGICQTMFV